MAKRNRCVHFPMAVCLCLSRTPSNVHRNNGAVVERSVTAFFTVQICHPAHQTAESIALSAHLQHYAIGPEAFSELIALPARNGVLVFIPGNDFWCLCFCITLSSSLSGMLIIVEDETNSNSATKYR